MRTIIAALCGMMLLGFSSAVFAGQITRSRSHGREIVTLVDHGETPGHAAIRVRGATAAKRKTLPATAELRPEPVPVANVETVDEMSAGVVRSMLSVRLSSSDSADLPQLGIDPTAHELRVLGAVPSDAARETVEFQAMNLTGTDAVRNEVRLLDYAPSVDLVYDDEHIAERVQRAILAWPELHGADIEVDVDQGITTLTGAVPTAEQRTLASAAAATAPGVYIVQNRLNLRPE